MILLINTVLSTTNVRSQNFACCSGIAILRYSLYIHVFTLFLPSGRRVAFVLKNDRISEILKPTSDLPDKARLFALLPGRKKRQPQHQHIYASRHCKFRYPLQ